MIVIIDYGMGNLQSVHKAFKRIKVDTLISRNIEDINRADKLVLPGVGHFAKGMKRLMNMQRNSSKKHLKYARKRSQIVQHLIIKLILLQATGERE